MDDNQLQQPNYPPNSAASRKPQPGNDRGVKAVTNAKVRTHKKTFGEKLKEALFAEDLDNVGIWMIKDVMIPAFKKTVYDMFTGGLGMMMGYRRPPEQPNGYYTSYSSYYSRPQPQPQRTTTEVGRYNQPSINPLDVVIPTREKAEEIRDQLYELLNAYNFVRVSDFLELAGVRGSWADNGWGWQDLHGTRVEAVYDGYILTLPRAKAWR